MSIDVKAMLAKKAESKKNTQLVIRDVNRDLITSLLAVSVYGKEARDEEILSVIINAGQAVNPLMLKIREDYQQMVRDKKVKKGKDGFVRDADGFRILVPRE